MNANVENHASPESSGGNTPKHSPAITNKDHPFLEGLNSHQHQLLSDCAIHAHFEPDETIFREGDPANRFYLIQKGRVALEVRNKDHGCNLIQTVRAGEGLGWSWLFPPCFWHFDARALEPTEALFIQGKILREECEADHHLGYELTKRLAAVMLRRLQATRRQLLKLNEDPLAKPA